MEERPSPGSHGKLEYPCFGIHLDDFEREEPDPILSILLHDGSLATATSDRPYIGHDEIFIRIPNLAQRARFAKAIADCFEDAAREDGRNLKLARALIEGDADGVMGVLSTLAHAHVFTNTAGREISSLDYARMLLAILRTCGDSISSLRLIEDGGSVFSLIAFASRQGDKAAVAAVKASASEDRGFIDKDAEAGLHEIEEGTGAAALLKPLLADPRIRKLTATGLGYVRFPYAVSRILKQI